MLHLTFERTEWPAVREYWWSVGSGGYKSCQFCSPCELWLSGPTAGSPRNESFHIKYLGEKPGSQNRYLCNESIILHWLLLCLLSARLCVPIVHHLHTIKTSNFLFLSLRAVRCWVEQNLMKIIAKTSPELSMSCMLNLSSGFFPSDQRFGNRLNLSLETQSYIGRRREKYQTSSTSVYSPSYPSSPSSPTSPPSSPYSGPSPDQTTSTSSTGTFSWWISSSSWSTVHWTSSGASTDPPHHSSGRGFH